MRRNEMNEDVIRALSSKTRRSILKELREKALTPTVLSRRLGKHKSTVVEHLKILRDSELVKKEKVEGRKRVLYSLTMKGKELTSSAPKITLVLVLPLLSVTLGFILIIKHFLNTLGGKISAGVGNISPNTAIIEEGNRSLREGSKSLSIMTKENVTNITNNLTGNISEGGKHAIGIFDQIPFFLVSGIVLITIGVVSYLLWKRKKFSINI